MIEISVSLLTFQAFFKHITKYISIIGLHMKDVELDDRVTALEENSGGEYPRNGKLYPQYLPNRTHCSQWIYDLFICMG